MPSPQARPVPEWVMLGVPHPEGGVELYASKSLTQAELESRVDVDQDWQRPGPVRDLIVPDSRRFDLRVTSTDVTIVYGPDYATALHTLLMSWSPDTPEVSRHEITSPPSPALQP